MKKSAKHIITILYALSALTMYLSCTREEIPAVMPGGSNLAINTKADGVPVFAYLPENLKAGNYTAIAPATQKNDNYYYNVPEGATKIIFSNLSGKETERVKFTGNETGLVSIAVKSDEIITSDILLGSIGDFIIGSDNPYSIQLKRLNAEFETKLQVVNDNDEEIAASSVIKSAAINIRHLATQVNIAEDLSFVSSGDADTTLAMSESGTLMTTNIKKFIPSSQKCELTVTVTDSKDKTRSYSVTLDRIFEFNRSYTINLKLRKENSYDSQFTFLEPEITESTMELGHYTYNDYDMFIRPNASYILEKEAQSSVEITVQTAVPVDWTPSVIYGNEHITASKTDKGNLLITANSENSGDSNREAIIQLTSFDGLHSKKLYVTQLCANSIQTIKFIPGTTYTSYYTITGSNLNIKYGQESVALESGRRYSIPSEYNNSEVTITGSAIHKADFSASKTTFDNCTSLFQLTLNYNEPESIDLSTLSNLRTAEITGGNTTGILFSETQPVEELTLNSFTQLENLELTKVADYLKKLTIDNCDKLKSITLYNTEYAKERNLQFFSVSDCNAITGISVVNYTKLEYATISYNSKLESLNVSGCTSLETLDLSNLTACKFINLSKTTSLKKISFDDISSSNSYCDILTEKTPSIETIDFNDENYLNSLDLSEHEKLVYINIKDSYSNIKNLNLSNCPSLKEIGNNNYTINITKLNLDNTPALENINISFHDNTDIYLSALNTGAKNIRISQYNKTIDFTTHFTKAEVCNLYNYTGTELNLSATNTLQQLTITNSSYKRQFETMLLPSSLKKLSISGYYDNSKPSGKLDLSALKSLESIYIEYTGITELILNGMPAIKTVNLNDCRLLKTINTSGSGLNSFSSNRILLETTDFSNCSNLEFVEILRSNLSSLNIQNCSILKELEVSTGKLQYVDFTTCREIYNIDLRNNIIETENMNRIFTELPDRTNDVVTGKLNLTGNPGAETCDKNIAYNKNWFFVN